MKGGRCGEREVWREGGVERGRCVDRACVQTCGEHHLEGVCLRLAERVVDASAQVEELTCLGVAPTEGVAGNRRAGHRLGNDTASCVHPQRSAARTSLAGSWQRAGNAPTHARWFGPASGEALCWAYGAARAPQPCEAGECVAQRRQDVRPQLLQLRRRGLRKRRQHREPALRRELL